MKRNLERMRYKNDTLSSGLCIAAIAFNVAYFIMIYANSSIVPDYATGIDVLLNILFMLASFWASEQVKVYDRKWSFGVIALGAAQIARLFWLPERYYKLEQLVGMPYMMVRIMLICSASAMIIAGVISCINSTALHRYLTGLDKTGTDSRA